MDDGTDRAAVGASTAGIDLRVTEDRMQVFLSCDPAALRLPDLFDQVAARLRELKIVLPPDRESLESAVAGALSGDDPRLTDLLLVTGIVAVEACDGRLEWSREFFDTHYPVDPKTGEIDFRRRVGDPTVSAGELLVKVCPARPGTPGRNVFGQALPVRAPVETKITPAENVERDDDEGGYRAACSGRVSFRDGRLKVDPVLLLQGDVGASSGNVRHQGSVVIKGDVDAGYSVEATGDIEIGGMVYDAHVKSGGDLAIAGGVNGNTRCRLESRGDLHAKFVLNATIRAGGDIQAEREIYQSEVEAGGEVRVPAGRIVGGVTHAVRGITVGEAGSSSDPSTHFVLKPDRDMLAGLQAIKTQVAEAAERIRTLRQTIRQYKQQAALLTDAGKKKMALAATELVQLEAWVAARNRENQTIVRQIEEDQSAVIQVLERIHPGVAIKIHHGNYRCDVEMLGPLIARLNRGTGQIDLESPEEEVAGEGERTDVSPGS